MAATCLLKPNLRSWMDSTWREVAESALSDRGSELHNNPRSPWGSVKTWSICHTESASSSWAPSSDPGALGAGRRPGLSASKSGPASVASFAFGLYCQAMTEPSLVHASSRFVD